MRQDVKQVHAIPPRRVHEIIARPLHRVRAVVALRHRAQYRSRASTRVVVVVVVADAKPSHAARHVVRVVRRRSVVAVDDRRRVRRRVRHDRSTISRAFLSDGSARESSRRASARGPSRVARVVQHHLSSHTRETYRMRGT